MLVLRFEKLVVDFNRIAPHTWIVLSTGHRDNDGRSRTRRAQFDWRNVSPISLTAVNSTFPRINMEMQIKYTLKPGDLVKLKSGGPKMTVMEIDEIAALGVGGKPVEAYRCEWFTPRDVLKSKSFPFTALEKYVLATKDL